MQTYSLSRGGLFMKAEKKMSLTKKYILAYVSLVSMLMFNIAHSQETNNIPEQGKLLIKSFSSDLKTELQKAIKEGGLKNGIEVCSEKAPAIAEKYSSNEWQIKRTSLKVRNPENVPTDLERDILLQFEVKKDEGIAISELSYYEKEITELGKTHRMMKAIPTQGLCLGCHGDTLSEEVKTELSLLYPNDQATGFKEGDIRGAFSLVYHEIEKDIETE